MAASRPMTASRPEPMHVVLAQSIAAYHRCVREGNTEWRDRYEARVKQIQSDLIPSEGGIDSGVTIDVDASTPNNLVFHVDYHHLDHKTSHRITIRRYFVPDLHFSIDGRDRNDIKDHLFQVLDYALRRPVAYSFKTDGYVPYLPNNAD